MRAIIIELRRWHFAGQERSAVSTDEPALAAVSLHYRLAGGQLDRASVLGMKMAAPPRLIEYTTHIPTRPRELRDVRSRPACIWPRITSSKRAE